MAISDPMASIATLDQARLESLPQELIDLIQDFTFKAFINQTDTEWDFSVRLTRRRHVADLKILQLNRFTRTQYAEMFYQQRTFSFKEEDLPPWYVVSDSMMRWLKTVPADHRTFIKKIIYISPPTNGSTRAMRGYQSDAKYELKGAERLYGKKVSEKICCRFLLYADGDIYDTFWPDQLL